MRTAPQTAENSWGRLQDLLLDLKPGQTVTANGVAARTGVGVDSVKTVLEALTRAELFVRIDRGTFLRQRLRQPATDSNQIHTTANAL